MGSRAPCGARRKRIDRGVGEGRISIHVPLAGHDGVSVQWLLGIDISIHVPLARHDETMAALTARRIDFNPRAPCGARRRGEFYQGGRHAIFQSTCPLRGTTRSSMATRPSWRYFNPRAPCGARRRRRSSRPTRRTFQSTFPLRGTTLAELLEDSEGFISIHVPLAGHDVVWQH